MKEVIRYQCEYCGDLFSTKEFCLEHEDKHDRIIKANQMLKSGFSLGRIQRECNIWRSVPEHLQKVNTENCFVISYWQCCDKPAYRIVEIDMSGKVRLWGCGSWSGYYGRLVGLNDFHLNNPHPKEELFVDKRYKEMSGW
jgi:hypothetical protein